MTNFARLTFLLTIAAGLTLPLSSASAQLKIDEKEASAELLVAVAAESEPALPPKAEVMTVYIPEPATFGLFGAAALGLLLAVRRVTVRSSALAA
jgi:PEP-CTERM motif